MGTIRFNKGTGAVFFAVIAFSFAPVFIRITLAEGMGSEWIATLRLILVAILLTIVTLARKQARIQFKHISRKDLIVSLLGALALTAHFVTWVLALKYTTAFASTALVCVQIIFVAALSGILLREKQSWILLAAVIPAIIGSLLIGGSDLVRLGNSIGAIYSLASALCIALYFIAGRVARRNMTVNTYTQIVYGSGAVMLLAYSLLFAQEPPVISSKGLAALIGLVVVCTFLGHSVANWSLKFVDGVFVSMITLLQPLLTLIWAMLIFGEYPSLEIYIGTGIILIGIAVYLFIVRRQNKLRS